MSDFSLSISADVAYVQECLRKTAISQKAIMRKVLRVVGGKVVKEIKKEIASSTARVSGELRRAYMYRVSKDATQVAIFARGAPKSTCKKKRRGIHQKVTALNYGAVISAKKAKYLQVSGKNFFAKEKSVKIEGRGFLQKAWSGYLGNGNYTKDVQSVVDSELDKFWGR